MYIFVKKRLQLIEPVQDIQLHQELCVEKCLHCNGKGYMPSNNLLLFAICNFCQGTGELNHTNNQGTGELNHTNNLDDEG